MSLFAHVAASAPDPYQASGTHAGPLQEDSVGEAVQQDACVARDVELTQGGSKGGSKCEAGVKQGEARHGLLE